MMRRGCGDSGFTLLEVMVAVALLSFAVVSILGVVSYNINLASRSSDFLIAASLADEMASKIDAVGVPAESNESGEFENHPKFRWEVAVIPYNLPQMGVLMKLVTIVITWDDGEESYEVSFIAEGG